MKKENRVSIEFEDDEGLTTDIADEMYARGFTASWIREVTFQYLEIFSDVRLSRKVLNHFESNLLPIVHGLRSGLPSNTASA